MNQKPVKPPHTQIPNVLLRWVMPLLSPGEQSCLLYILTHTVGFADPERPGHRKEFDVISLSQFEHGVTSGNYLLDLGTGMSRNTIRAALDDLVSKGLVEMRYQCLKCLWKPTADDPTPEIADGSKKSPSCPRCKKTLDRAFGLSELRPSRVIELLNVYDKQGRRFTWDTDAKRPVFERPGEEDEKKRKQQDFEEEAARLRDLLWFPELVDQVMKHAEGHLKAGGKITLSRRVNGFYRPVYELQEKYPIGELVRFALAETIRRRIADKADNRTWHHYTASICKNHMDRYTGQKAAPGTNAALAVANSVETHEKAVCDMLRRAAELNGRGEVPAARELLSSILAQAKLIAPLFGGDVAMADNSIREAFKQGVDYVQGVEPLAYYPNNNKGYYAEWEWPEDQRP